MNRGWAWMDGTAATNLNCGGINAVGCGAWSLDEPNDSSDGENGSENWAIMFASSKRAQDLPATSTARVVCETEVSALCPLGWAFYADDGSEGMLCHDVLACTTPSAILTQRAACSSLTFAWVRRC